jgi:hypothetical protein
MGWFDRRLSVSVNETSTVADRFAGRINPDLAGETVSDPGAVPFKVGEPLCCSPALDDSIGDRDMDLQRLERAAGQVRAETMVGGAWVDAREGLMSAFSLPRVLAIWQ